MRASSCLACTAVWMLAACSGGDPVASPDIGRTNDAAVPADATVAADATAVGADAGSDAGCSVTGGGAIDLQPSNGIDFGSVGIGGHRDRRLTITNVGTDPLRLMSPMPATSCSQGVECASGLCQCGNCWAEKIADIEVRQGTASEFSLRWPPEGYAPHGLVSGQSSELEIRFAPQSLGAKLAYLKVYSNDPDRPVAEFELQGFANNLPPCDYEVVPPLLAFGTVEMGKDLILSFHIRNKAVSSTNECVIFALGLDPASPSPFTLVNGPLTNVSLRGGASLEVPVRFAPLQSGTYSGLVDFEISGWTAPEGQVALTGTAQSASLLVAPNEVDFGTVQMACNSWDRAFTVYNISSTTQTIRSIEMQQGTAPEFTFTQLPVFPYVLSAGQSVDFKVKYGPPDVGADQGSISIATSTQTYVVPVQGRGDPTDLRTDRFTANPKADVLFVLDNSATMSEAQIKLAASIPAFLQLAAGVDYHIAVTTTSVDQAHGGVADGFAPDENGCFVPQSGGNPQVVSSQTPNADQVLAQNVNVGMNGNSVEQLIRPAYLALTYPNLDGCNAGFLRDDASLAVVVVSDAGDQDPSWPVSFYENAFLTIKGFERRNDFSFSGILLQTQSDPACVASGDGTVALIPRVEQIVAATGGVLGDFCSTDWTGIMQTVGQNAFGARMRYFLTTLPDAIHAIAVAVDGVPYEATDPSGATRWEYNATANAIDFAPLGVPEPGSTIEVSYHVSCLH